MKRYLYTLIAFFLPLLALAQERQPKTSITTPEKVIALIDKAGGWFYSALIGIAVIYIIYAGFKFLTAGGDEKKIEEARQQLIYAIIAVAVAMLATGIVKVMKQFLGVTN
ncbi:MAG: pilin [Patescibacteria group bacterium]